MKLPLSRTDGPGTAHRPFSLRDMLLLVDAAFGLMNQETNRHHHMVSHLSWHLAQAAGLSETMQYLTMQAAYIHDIGGAVRGTEVSLSDIESSAFRVAQLGADLLEDMPSFVTLAAIIRHSQTPYRECSHLKLPGTKLRPLLVERLGTTPLADPLTAAHLIHLADAVSLMIQPGVPVLNQVGGILERTRAESGAEFAPHAVRALEELAGNEQIWLDLAYSPRHSLGTLLEDRLVGLDGAVTITRLLAMVIDFRSPFTAMHSAGVAASAKALARLWGMGEEECIRIEIAGNLHDLGKIRTPAAILEKPGKLSDEEFNIIKEHAYFTDILLREVRGFEEIGPWAALHHEKLNGSGYPYHLTEKEIPLGAKIMAVADVFSAITEDRPYRKGMEPERVQAILRENAARGELSSPLVELLIAHYEEVNGLRERASHEAGGRYYRSIQGKRA